MGVSLPGGAEDTDHSLASTSLSSVSDDLFYETEGSTPVSSDYESELSR